MHPTHRHQLVDGTFTPAEAAQVLLSLVKSKIDFHTLEKASNEERFGRDTAHSERRLEELRRLQETLRLACQDAAEAGQQLRVSGVIEITAV